MKTPRLAVTLLFLGAAVGSVTGAWLDHQAQAARNSGGTYSLPAGNPVVSGTTVSSAWANTTLTDLGTAVTDSLDRQGRGGMSAPLKLAPGSAALPGLTFAIDTDTGLFRNGANDIRLVAGGAEIQRWLSTGSSVTGSFSVSSGLTVTGSITSSANSLIGGDTVVDAYGQNTSLAPAPNTPAYALKFGGAGSGEAIASRRIAGANAFGLDFYANSVQRLSLNSLGIQIPGATSATPGTPFSGVYSASASSSIGSLAASSGASQLITTTGAAVASTCELGWTNLGSGPQTGIVCVCSATAANTARVYCFNGDTVAHTPGGTFYVRVINN